MILPSEPVTEIAAAAIAIDCGEIILPAVAPAEFAATSHAGSIDNWLAISVCNFANITHADVAEPVTKHPIPPMIGAMNG
jgi:hypothetical protein